MMACDVAYRLYAESERGHRPAPHRPPTLPGLPHTHITPATHNHPPCLLSPHTHSTPATHIHPPCLLSPPSLWTLYASGM